MCVDHVFHAGRIDVEKAQGLDRTAQHLALSPRRNLSRKAGIDQDRAVLPYDDPYDVVHVERLIDRISADKVLTSTGIPRGVLDSVKSVDRQFLGHWMSPPPAS